MWWGEMARNTHLSFSTQASAPLVEQITSSFRYGKDVYQVEYWKFQPYLILSISVWNSIWNGWSKCLVKKSVSLQLVDDHACEPWALWAGACWENALCRLDISCHSQLPGKRSSDGWSIEQIHAWNTLLLEFSWHGPGSGCTYVTSLIKLHIQASHFLG